MLNKVILMGRLTKDPELRQTPSGVSVASFTLAVERSYAKPGEDKETDFINIIAWRNTADFVSKYFTKGQLVAISGKLQVRSWEDTSGQKRYATDVVADEVFFAESKNAQGGQVDGATSMNPSTTCGGPPPFRQGRQNGEDDAGQQGSLAGFTSADEDLPF